MLVRYQQYGWSDIDPRSHDRRFFRARVGGTSIDFERKMMYAGRPWPDTATFWSADRDVVANVFVETTPVVWIGDPDNRPRAVATGQLRALFDATFLHDDPHPFLDKLVEEFPEFQRIVEDLLWN